MGYWGNFLDNMKSPDSYGPLGTLWPAMNKIGGAINPFSPADKNQQAMQPQQADADAGLQFGDQFFHYPGRNPAPEADTAAAGNPDQDALFALLRKMGAGGGGYDAGAPYDSQINELRRQLAMAQGLNNQGKQDVNVGYNALADYWKKDVPTAFRGIYGSAVASTNKSADKLRAAIKGNYDKATAGTAEQMAKFGINTGQMGQQQANQVASSNASQQAQLQGLADSRSEGNKDFYQKMNASAGKFATNAAGLTKEDQQRALGSLRQQLYNTTMDTQGKIGDISRERTAAINKAGSESQNQRLSALLKLHELTQGASPADLDKAAQSRLKTETEMVGSDPIAFIRNAAMENGTLNEKKLTDLMNEFNYISSSRFNQDEAKKLGITDSRWKPSMGDYAAHLPGAAQHAGAGSDYIQTIMRALQIMNGDYKATDYGY